MENCENTPIFLNVDPKWCGNEELLLLNAIEICGYRNWDYVAMKLTEESGKSFTADEVQDHYDKIYVHGAIGKALWKNQVDEKISVNIAYVKTEVNSDKIDSSQYQERLGYMPLREEFAKDYDYGAEYLLEEIDFATEDKDGLDKDFKLAIIDIYRRRVKERAYWNEVVKSQGLVEKYLKSVSESISQQGRKRKHPESSDTRSKLPEESHLARLYTGSELNDFYELCQKERKLKKEIKELVSLKEHVVTESDGKEETKSKSKIRKMSHTETLAAVRRSARDSHSPERLAYAEGCKLSVNKNSTFACKKN